MYRRFSNLLPVALTVAICSAASAGILYPGPPSWWTYMYQGDKAAPGAGSTALDGKWSHDNGSDAWDESPLGSGAPGGASALVEDGVTFLRIQDCGDPRPNPADPSNRKVMFGHVMSGEVDAAVSQNILDNGVTITFRARIPTSGLLDELNTAGAKTPYPAGGDGYVPHDGGKDNFSVRQANGDKIVSFALALASDDEEMGGKSGLTMNKLNGTSPSGDVDVQGTEPGTMNILELDPTQWHEFWITIQADPTGTGTHMATIYVDGSMDPEVFYLTAGDGDDYADNYIAMGVGATPQSGAIDIDFFAYKPGVIQPDEVYKASGPSPADGDRAVAIPLFQWKPGGDAALHNVYLGASPELTEADLVLPRSVVLVYYRTQPLTPGTTYYWRVDEIGVDGETIYTGNVWSFTTQGVKAYYPTPADGSNDASTGPVLTWLPGQVTLKHHVYFGTSAEDVNQGTAAADKGETEEPTFTPGALDSAATYYWRIDETVAGGPVQTGAVWSFTTVMPVDDFESYTDNDDGTRIYQTWIDGYADQSSGSTVGHIDAPFAEQTIVHGGQQSMPLDYNNINTPFYSEAEREFAPVEDWTANELDTLVLHVRGQRMNKPAPLYVAIEDASKHQASVAHPDPAVVTTARWTEWKIPLSTFADAGVNLARVKFMRIGVGDPANPVGGATGQIFIDDIWLTRPAPAAAK